MKIVVSSRDLLARTPAPAHTTPLVLTPSGLGRSASGAHSDEFGRAGILPPAPVATAPVHAPLGAQVMRGGRRCAALRVSRCTRRSQSR